MKKHLLVSTVILTLTVSLNQTIAQSWQWARSAKGTDNDNSYSVATDANGNVFITGSFQSISILFGSQTLTNTDNTGATNDFYIAKYDANGNLLWAKSAGGTSDDYGKGVTTDGSGNVYATGYFKSASMVVGTYTLTNASAGTADVFLVKYDSNGNVVWANKYGGTSVDFAYAITATSSNIFITGSFAGTVTYGSTTLSAGGGAYVFTVGFDLNGNVIWAKQSQGSGSGLGISNDGSGNVYITGSFSGNASIVFSGTTLTNADGVGNNYDIFIVKYNATNGNLGFAKREGAVTDDVANSIKATSNSFFITGYFKGPTVTIGTTTLTNPDNTGFSSEIFTAKYDLSGNNLWAKQAIGSKFSEQGKGVTTDAIGNSYITGYAIGSKVIFGNDTIFPKSNADIFLVKYDGSGNVMWAKNLYSNYYMNYGYSVAVDNSSNIYVTGFFSGDTLYCANDTLINASNSKNEILLAKYGLSPTGIQEENNSRTVTIFPNPFSAQTVLQTVVPLTNATLTVDNCFGQTVAQIKNISGQTIVFKRDNLASGLYFVRLTEENKIIAVDKLVITDK